MEKINRKYNTIFLDMGHGGVTPEGEYTTAPSKMFKHTDGDFHQGSTFLEGVKNRIYGKRLEQKLVEKGINVVVLNHRWKDTPLQYRTQFANTYHQLIERGMYVSEHSNATGGHNARGFSIWTSHGQTHSDHLATKFFHAYEKEFPEMKTLRNERDKDPDYEAGFWVLRKTDMPSVLFENLFFDQKEDAEKLRQIDYLERYTSLQAEWCDHCLNWLSINA